MGTLGNVTDMPYSMLLTETDNESVCKALQADETITGVSSRTISAYDADVMGLKAYLAEQGIATGHLESSCDWSEFKLNSDGMIPVIVQDYKTNDVLMLAYMNEEAFQTTLSLGKMTYYSRSRNELWTKGMSSRTLSVCEIFIHRLRQRYHSGKSFPDWSCLPYRQPQLLLHRYGKRRIQ